MDINRAPLEMLLRVPGIGPKSARRIRNARRIASLGLDELRRMGVVLKRAQYFITCRGFSGAANYRREEVARTLIDPQAFSVGVQQLSLFDTPQNTLPGGEQLGRLAAPAVQQLVQSGVKPALAAKTVQEEAVQWIASAM